METAAGESGESDAQGDQSGEAGAEGELGDMAQAGGPQGDGAQGENGMEAGGGAQGDGGMEAGGDMAGGPQGSQGGAQGGPAGGGLDGLDEQLNGSLEVFEQGLEGRRIVLASNQPAGGDEGDAQGGGGLEQGGGIDDQTGEGAGIVMGGDESGPGEGENGTRVVAGLPGTASPGNQPGDNQREGDFKSGGVGGRVPQDVGDGSDDDVVARQIREAATNEPDPVLREKLWEEYRTYKKNAG